MPTPAHIREQREREVARLAEAVARHEAKGNFITAAVFAKSLVEAQDRLRECDNEPETC